MPRKRRFTRAPANAGATMIRSVLVTEVSWRQLVNGMRCDTQIGPISVMNSSSQACMI